MSKKSQSERVVRRRSDVVRSMPRTFVITALVAVLLVDIVGAVLFNLRDDSNGVKEVKGDGANLTLTDLGGTWNYQSSNVVVDDEQVVSELIESQGNPQNNGAIFEDPTCDGLISAASAYTGKPTKIAMTVTGNTGYAPAESESAPPSAPESSLAPEGEKALNTTSDQPVFAQVTNYNTDSVTGPLVVKTIREQVTACAGEPPLNADADAQIKEVAPDGYTVQVTEHEVADPESAVSYEVLIETKGEDPRTVIHSDIAVFSDPKTNATSILFLRSGDSDYDQGSEDLAKFLPAAQKRLAQYGDDTGTAKEQ